MMDLLQEYQYVIITTVIYLFIYLAFQLKVKKAQNYKLKMIKNRRIINAIETDSPEENPRTDLREKGIELIEHRFSLISRALPLLLFMLWLLTIVIPYLNQIPSVYISIIAAVVSVIAGFSLRPFLENLFAGVIISFFKAIRIGDTVYIDGHYGLIEEIGITYSVLKKWDWSRVVMPNSKLIQKEVQNLTLHDNHIWAHIEFYVSPDSKIEEVEKIALEVAESSKFNTKVEKPSFWIINMEKDCFKCWLAAWADGPSDAWELKHDMRIKLIKKFNEYGIKLNHYNISTSDLRTLK